MARMDAEEKNKVLVKRKETAEGGEKVYPQMARMDAEGKNKVLVK